MNVQMMRKMEIGMKKNPKMPNLTNQDAKVKTNSALNKTGDSLEWGLSNSQKKQIK